MIFLKLTIDNFFMFKDTSIDFTYPKKIKNSTIEGEYLEEFPKIKYKKVCIFMGANASGKTTLGRMMCAINNYLIGRSMTTDVTEAICDKKKQASYNIVYVTVTSTTKEIHQLSVRVNGEGLVYEEYKSCKLKKSKNFENTLKELDTTKPKSIYNENNKHGIENPGFKSVAYLLGHLNSKNTAWKYMFSAFNNSDKLVTNVAADLLKTILSSFDSSIKDVKEIKDSSKNAYVIKFTNGDTIIVEDGKMLNPERLSRGTLESIEVCVFIDFLIRNHNSSLFLDEKMAYSHSEIEIAILNLMIEKLETNSQLFYTTHNYDILEMNLPSHSYIFMKKEDFVEVIHPEQLGFTKNDRNLLSFVKNDVFDTLPNTTKIEELLQ